MDMEKEKGLLLLNSLHPNFFDQEDIRSLPAGLSFNEMILRLDSFDPCKYDKTLDDSVTFEYYKGDIGAIKKAVEKVEPDWSQFFDEEQEVYCGLVNGEIASFCHIDDMGIHNIGGREVRVGGLGCVGTLPEYRDRGIGLTMVRNATQILKEEGYDYSYIHYTSVAPWYEKLGYEILIKWTKNGVV